MFTDEAAILQAAATLAAAEFTVDGLSGGDPIDRAVLRGDGPVERLIEILIKMEKRGVIPPGYVPSAPDPARPSAEPEDNIVARITDLASAQAALLDGPNPDDIPNAEMHTP